MARRRAGCVTLAWVLSLRADHLDCCDTDSADGLPGQLCELIQRLVIGHLPDLDLDMRKLFKAGLLPVLAAQRAGHAESTGLAVAMLSRLAVDCTLIPESLPYASRLYSVFCKCSKPNCDLSCPSYQSCCRASDICMEEGCMYQQQWTSSIAQMPESVSMWLI